MVLSSIVLNRIEEARRFITTLCYILFIFFSIDEINNLQFNRVYCILTMFWIAFHAPI